MSLKDNIEILIKSKIKDHYKEVKSLMTPAIGVKIIDALNKVYISKFGGVPDVSETFEWPTFNGKLMLFLCQIKLSELEGFEKHEYMPNKGMLYFFLRSDFIFDQGAIPNLKGEFKVLFLENDTSLNSYSFEQNQKEPFRFDELNFRFYQHYTFPEWDSIEAEENPEIYKDDIIEQLYSEICEMSGHPSDIIGHQILGKPNSLQACVSFLYSMSELGYNFSNGPLDKEKTEIASLQSKKYINLLQIDCEDKKLNFSEIFLGDDVLYFGIKEEDLKNKDFSSVMFEMQIT